MKTIIQIFLIMITVQTTAQDVAQEGKRAVDFEATTIDGKPFHLSDFQGQKIFLSFFRNGACALCNLRVHEISTRQREFDAAGIKVIAVFESTVDDMKPYVGKQQLSFTLLSDPTGKIYQQYGVRNSPEIIQEVMRSGSAHEKVSEAAAAGFTLIPQEGSNFFRIPAEVLIDKNFEIVKVHHCTALIDHLTLDEILKF